MLTDPASTPFPKEDSNPHNQNQNLKCYHYTIGEYSVRRVYRLTQTVSSRYKGKNAAQGMKKDRPVSPCFINAQYFIEKR